MKRIVLILAGVVVAGGVAATPAVAGLAGNPSFSHEIPVPPPSVAKTPQFADDRGHSGTTVRPADDHGGQTRHAEPGDDRGGQSAQVEPGDDHGGQTPHAEPGDDRGGATTAAEPADDHGRHGGGRG